MTPSSTSMLAIGLDAAEASLVGALIDQGRMPALARVAAAGRWQSVRSPADIGSGSVWPTFISGAGPEVHGAYGEWIWQPDRMGLHRYAGGNITPFWTDLADAGVRVGVADVPFAPHVGLREGFEVTEWGPHDRCDGRRRIGPGDVAALVESVPAHPFDGGFVDPVALPGRAELAALGSACATGIERRGDLYELLIRERRPEFALLVFTEIHHASHYLWPTVDPHHALFANFDDRFSSARVTLADVYEAVDRQVGRLVSLAGDAADVAVFSLHGMRAGTGIAALLGPVLASLGFSTLAGWRSQSWRARAATAFGAMKRHSPAALKQLYYSVVPPTAAQALARPTMLPPYDWRRTRAFALPSDQHGWIRVNLEGREALGIVRAGEYDDVCDDLLCAVRELRDEAGSRLVARAFRTARSAGQAHDLVLPDIVVHWTDAALRGRVRVANFGVVAETIGRKFTSQHALDGFCVSRGGFTGEEACVDAADLGARFCRARQAGRGA